MKTLKYAVITLIVGFSNLFAMQQAGPSAPAAMSSAPSGATSAQAAVKQDLYIKNNYVDKILVQYMVADKPNVFEFTLAPGEEGKIEDIRNVIDIKLQAYGQYKQYLNFTKSPNYRTALSEALANERVNDLRLNVDAAKAWSAEQEKKAEQAVEYPPQSAKQWFWGKAVELYRTGLGYLSKAGAAVISRVGPFTISVEPVKTEKLKPYVSEQYEGRFVYQEFPQVEAQIKSGGPIYGRHILGISADASPLSAKTRATQLLEYWNEAHRQAVINQDPRAAEYTRLIAQLITEAGEDPKREFSRSTFTVHG